MQDNAEHAVRQMLMEFSQDQKLAEVGTVTAEDQMDDGTPIRVCHWPFPSNHASTPLFAREDVSRQALLYMAHQA
jgi:hypothetical protein